MHFPEWTLPALRIRKVIIGKDFYARKKIKLKTITLGNAHAAWTIYPENLSASSIVYSFGIGKDLSFDIALIKKCGAIVQAFDPTPDTIAWLHNQHLPAELHHHPVGIAAYDGAATFFAPGQSGSNTLLQGIYTTTSCTVQVKKLQTIMAGFGHQQIDLLKMDIEGAEYEVIEDMLKNKIPVQQLLVEFHHRFPTIGINRSLKIIDKLEEAGYKLFYLSPSGEEFSFIYSD